MRLSRRSGCSARSRCGDRSSRSSPRPFALVLVVGTRAHATPRVEAELRHRRRADARREPRSRPTLIRRAPQRAVDRVELLLELPRASRWSKAAPRAAFGSEPAKSASLPFVLRCTTWGSYGSGDVRVRARDAVPAGHLGGDAREHRIASRRIRGRSRCAASSHPSRRRRSPAARSRGSRATASSTRTSATSCPGDRVRAINWRASARRQGLVVNERHPERNTDVVLFVDSFVDVRGADRSVLEDAVRAAAVARDALPRAPQPRRARRLRGRAALAPARAGDDAALPPDRDDARDGSRSRPTRGATST